MGEGPIKRFFGIGGEDTGRQLALPGMVTEALATISLARAGFIGAIAALPVFFVDTIHLMLLDPRRRPADRRA
jgi:hypothetical protein